MSMLIPYHLSDDNLFDFYVHALGTIAILVVGVAHWEPHAQYFSFKCTMFWVK